MRTAVFKYPETKQFREIIQEIRNRNDYKGDDELGYPIYEKTNPYPKVKFKGTVKLHGSNCGITIYPDGSITYQSRESYLVPGKDNYNFAGTFSNINLLEVFKPMDVPYVVYGEWCGKGIQNKAAITKINRKIFVIFGVKKILDIDTQKSEWINFEPDFGIHPSTKDLIYNIKQFKQFEIDVDFENPRTEELEELTLEVEKQCPVAINFGVDGIGEGIVWTAKIGEKTFRFKTKGIEHKGTKEDKIIKLKPIDVESTNQFIDATITLNRLEQGIEKLKEKHLPIDTTSTGEYIKWVINDVVKEEADTIETNNVDIKQFNKLGSKKARDWYFEYLNKQIFKQ